ncbi:MAG: folate family ECF transporter S component [Roseburia sp.]|nr:folate family ECF transporter S component [Roseburia sp.]
MKKFVTLFTDSYRELKSVRTITTMAMLAALAVILGMFSIEYGQYIRIGFSSIPNGVVAYLFGPAVGGIFAGALDILKYILKPTGPFCPQLTLVTMLAGVLYGCMYYKKKITLPRVLAAKFIVMLVCNVFLNTLCLSVLYGQVFMEIIPLRALKNLIMWPIDSVIFYATTKALESIGAFRIIRRSQSVHTGN